jgi:hypothetical protein
MTVEMVQAAAPKDAFQPPGLSQEKLRAIHEGKTQPPPQHTHQVARRMKEVIKKYILLYLGIV